MTAEDTHSTGSTIRVAIADDHAVVRRGIRALLTEAGGFEVVGEADNGQAAVLLAQSVVPDVLLMDIMMPGMSGIDATRQITASHPEIRVLVLTSFSADSHVFPAIKAGAAGYLLKESSPDELVQGIRQVHRGEPSLHPTIARKLLQEISRPADPQPSPEALTDREMDVLRLIAQGLSNQDIADRLMVSEPTVRAHVSHILGKLHLVSRTQAALYAVREGLADASSASDPEEWVPDKRSTNKGMDDGNLRN